MNKDILIGIGAGIVICLLTLIGAVVIANNVGAVGYDEEQPVGWEESNQFSVDRYKQPEPQPAPERTGGGSSNKVYYPSKQELIECNDRVYEGVGEILVSPVSVHQGIQEIFDTVYSSNNIKCIHYTRSIIDLLRIILVR